MELITSNLTGASRRERLDDRDWVVVPVSMIVPGVLNGSQGPILYELADIQANPSAWNGMPITNGHPGESARQPKVWERYGLGYVYNTIANGKLAAEAWFDVAKTNRIDNRIIPAIERGERVSVSTGLGLDRESKTGQFNGIDYHGIARNYRPDHLAVLIDGQGACSVGDGCGLNMNSANEPGWVKSMLESLARLMSRNPSPVLNQDANVMTKLTADQRKAIVDDLITNCSCTWKEEDRKTLDGMDDATLNRMKDVAGKLKEGSDASTKLKQAETVLNAANKGLKIGDTQFVLNAKGEWEQKKETPAVDTSNVQKPIQASAENAAQRLTPEELEDLTFARNAKQAQKQQLVERLVANLADDKKQARREVLNKLTLAELEDRCQDLPAQPTQNQQTFAPPAPNYQGASAGYQPFYARNEEIKVPTPLGQPVWNFEAPKKEKVVYED